ncbi:AcrR family transcriptional regulator [Actinoalloteichus hoggarensis]|uniref:Transcriptional regulator, TetR family n=1 Tax=Actinoalloteichus hoggarensis TaxID=1470176 RepID=A0A221WAQ3_9PSEU|nr:TetR/AcrR family transcriptional regulator [Actinoalloteichus hoggarensis]ASO22666.1 Transcriptional regulator, TetR family [Actinoalloteichus hoggarensis]MBB5924192.1 AcrR family transcriptional regulator [Actinoalloteichus hoggarensis]
MPDDEARPQRSDWRRNHDRLLAVAATLIARDGEQVSLEKVAREAGVGSATLHRHFASRRALLEEVFQDVVERLRRRAAELACGDPRTGLVTWLEELTSSASATRGLAAALDTGTAAPTNGDSCHDVVRESMAALVDRALAAAVIRPEISTDDLLSLATAVSLATEDDPTTARRLIRIALDGIWH